MVNAKELSDYFELLMTIYPPAQEGRSLVEWLSNDWALFQNPNVSEAQAQILLGEILNDGDIVRGKFSLSDACRTDSLDRWKALAEELKRANRYFPDSGIDKERLGIHLSNLTLREDEKPFSWYRARIAKDGRQIELDDMGAPPAKLATSGRANPVGIPYLYLASSVDTAISEVRPQPGELVCVAEFALNSSLKIVDLRAPKMLISPFLEEDEGNIALLRGDIDFLEILGKELATPVAPDDASIDYIPSQYLCEFIKKCGFDGVAYGSSLSNGMNVAVFSPTNAKSKAVSAFSVTGLKLTTERYFVE